MIWFALKLSHFDNRLPLSLLPFTNKKCVLWDTSTNFDLS